MADPASIPELLARPDGTADAIRAPGRTPLTFDGLRQQMADTRGRLNGMGIGRGDRVGIVLPNGPEMATAFLSIASAATSAPLNPAYRQEEYEFYLTDLHARALVVLEGQEDSPAGRAAEAHGIRILQLRPGTEGPAGTFSLFGEESTHAEPSEGGPGPAQPDDVAIVLHTSGTTARPKIVPLLHRNVCASAANIRQTLGLTADDRCMNVMPLFHIHGLMACVLATLSAGGSVFCTPGFNALRFYQWLAESKPTWYSAVPTMHQAILARAAANRDIIEATNLRFIRSASASLPAPVMAELEATFRAPVVEAYAMTEASHQMTCNQLPPGNRKPGTVGVASGPEVAVMDDAGTILGPGRTGEIVVRGANVISAYENNPEANARSFTNGWFRTGDEGVVDEHGFFTVTGRLKEIINRGGEKISPREVDDVLMGHAAVQQVVTFALPHPMLGEEVAAAVVLREGARATEAEIRAFAAERVADFKVPRRIVFLDEIPKGPTGKLRRIGLAEQLGLGPAE